MNKKTNRMIGVVLSTAIIMSVLSSSVFADSGQRWNLGSVINTGKDNGYSGSNVIDLDDPHYGWTLGQFYVSGYTQHTTDSDGDVFLKNVGDEVELHFELLQDIDSLDGDDNLTIYEDSNGYDQYFGTQRFNDCRGLLIIRKTDYQNSSSDPIIYEAYLAGVDEGADTVVQLCEEGDYEVALDYEIEELHYGASWNTLIGVPTYTNYRIFFTFKIRNGNCMVFPFDVFTGSELTNESFTDNGFYLDLANSRYLDINVQRSVYVEGNNGYTEDIRFNRPASDGTQYTEEGIYTITVSNNYTNETTTKTIYVGTDPLMRAYVVTGYSLDEIQSMVSNGYQISDNGSIVAPDSGEEISDLYSNDTDSRIDKGGNESERSEKESGISAVPIVVTIIVLLLAGIGLFVFIKRDTLFNKRNRKGALAPDEKTSDESKTNETGSSNNRESEGGE